MTETALFAVKDRKFWILEQKLEDETKGKKESEYKVNAWVFNDEVTAIRKMKDLMKADKFNMDDPAALERLSNKYNLQEVEIARDKFNIKAVSMMKLVFIFAQEK
jgi:hypothetical protein